MQFLRKPIAGYAFGAVAAGELVADKLPGTPNRTEPFALAARALSGALSGAALWRRDRCAARGAVLGAAGAMMGAFAGYEIRRTLGQKLDVPDGLIAAAEDAIAVSGGLLVIDMSAR